MIQAKINFAKSIQSYIDGLEQFRNDFDLGGRIKPDRAFRYLIEDRLIRVAPEIVSPRLIPRSAGACQLIEAHTFSGGKEPKRFGDFTTLGLTYEHVVPLAVLFEIMVAERSDPVRLWSAIEHHARIAWVTHEEDEKLNELGFKSKMPDGWIPGHDPWARHSAANILY